MKTEHTSLVDRFYDNPTPADAVALALADARMDGNGTKEFHHQLSLAVDLLRDPVRAAAPVLLELAEEHNLSVIRNLRRVLASNDTKAALSILSMFEMNTEAAIAKAKP